MATMITPEKTVGELVVEQPSLSRVFEALGIDYCCGGKKPLEIACAEQGIALEDVQDRLQKASEGYARDADINPAELTFEELIDLIETTHHVYLKRELPRLEMLIGKVVNAHGDKDPRFHELAHVFAELQAELMPHMMKEERILFPLIRRRNEPGAPSASGPISVMEAEHDSAGDALASMRRLTDGYQAPEWACNTLRALMDGLQELEQDLHAHIHKENNILFPRVLEEERARG
jgi:regulator of cell morphogenesis and NO signaling